MTTPYQAQLARPVELDSGVWDEGHAERKDIPRALGVRTLANSTGIREHLERVNARNIRQPLPDAPARPRPRLLPPTPWRPHFAYDAPTPTATPDDQPRPVPGSGPVPDPMLRTVIQSWATE